jgi:hypothetical protein
MAFAIRFGRVMARPACGLNDSPRRRIAIFRDRQKSDHGLWDSPAGDIRRWGHPRRDPGGRPRSDENRAECDLRHNNCTSASWNPLQSVPMNSAYEPSSEPE